MEKIMNENMNITEFCEDKPYRSMVWGAATITEDYSIITADKAFYRFVGTSRDIPLTHIIYSEDHDVFKDAFAKAVAGKPQHLVLRLKNLTGEYHYYKARLHLNERNLLETPCVDIAVLDLTNAEYRCEELEFNVRKYRRYMAEMDFYYFEYSFSTGKFNLFNYLNDRANMMISLPFDEFCEMMTTQYINTEKDLRQFLTFKDYLEDGVDEFMVRFTTSFLSKAGRRDELVFKGSTFYHDDEKKLVMGVMTSGSAEKREEAFYQTDAAKDSSTGLFNKKAMVEYTKERIGDGSGNPLAMVIMDIDNFKHFNDSYGHLFGDEIINKVAAILKSTVGSKGVVGRFGGDEFVMVMDDNGEPGELELYIETIMNHMKYAYRGIKDEINLTASIGIARYPEMANNYEDLFKKADKALYIVKQNGKNNYLYYNEEEHQHINIHTVEMRKHKLAEMLSDVVIDSVMQLHEGGASAVSEVLKNVCNSTEISGIRIYTGPELIVDYVEGNYEIDFKSVYDYADEGYFNHFNSDNIFMLKSVEQLDHPYTTLYDACIKSDVRAFYQYAGMVSGKPEVLISYDIFNHSYAWSENEENLLHMLSRMLTRVLLDSRRMGEFIQGLGIEEVLSQDE